MAATITTKVEGSARVISRLSDKRNASVVAIERVVKSSAIGLMAYVKQNKLSGQVLRVRTGTLRRSITSRTEVVGNEIRGYVGTNLKYARVHEYGFKGGVPVRAHQRMMTVAFGKRVKNPRKIDVRAHSVKVNIPKRPFMAPSVLENKDKITNDIRKVLVEALR